MYYKYSNLFIWIFYDEQETFSTLNHMNGKRASEMDIDVVS